MDIDQPRVALGWADVLAARDERVRALIAVGSVEEARELIDQALADADKVTDDEVRLGALTNLAAAMREVGLAERAVMVLRDIIAQRRARLVTGGRPTLEALAAGLVNLATVLIDQGRAEDGLELLAEAEGYARELNDPVRRGTIQINVAVAFSAIGELRLARHAYRAAAGLYREGGADSSDVGYAVRGEAVTLAKSGRFAEAKVLYAEAGDLFAAAGLPLEVARNLVGYLMVRASLGEYLEPATLEAAEWRLPDLPPNEKGQLARNLGNIMLRQGNPGRADEMYRLARAQYELLDRPVDVASIDTNRAVAARRAGELDRARQLLLDARDRFKGMQRWQQVGQVDHNLSLVLTELADRGGPEAATLRAEACARSTAAVAALDRFRHDLPTARDRVALEQSVYPGLFPAAIEAAMAVDDVTTVAALVERARIQPVLPAARGSMEFLEPRPIAARPGDRPVGGLGAPVHLSEQAQRLAGPGATWIGWWSNDSDLSIAIVEPGGVQVEARQLGDVLGRLARALPIPTPDEREKCADEATADALALWRAARGPLLDDEMLADQLALILPASLRESIVDYDADGEVDLLWQLSRLLLGDRLLAELATGSNRRPLVLAPPSLLGRVPWSALPVTDPGHGAPRRLIEVADLVIALPASLLASIDERDHGETEGGVLVVADPKGDLGYARRLRVADVERLGSGHRPATRAAFVEAARTAALLVLAGHVQPGEPADPAASAIRLAADADGAQSDISVADLAELRVPPTCLLLGCDGAGAATGNEWTGVATGLVWAGAGTVVTTIWPMIDDRVSTAADEALIDQVRRDGPDLGLWAWQRAHAVALRTGTATRADAIYRWAGTVVVGSPRQTVDGKEMQNGPRGG